MQIIIEIDEEEYQTYINHTEAILDSSIPLVHQDLLRAVINGTPLPKGHGRLIDADAVEKEMNKSEVEADRNDDYYTADKIDCAMEYIINAETIIEADGGDAE